MHNLTFQTITSIVSIADDLQAYSTGRPAKLANSKVVAMLVFGTLILKTKTLKAIYKFFTNYHRRELPSLPTYANFVKHCHRIGGVLVWILQQTFNRLARLRFVDSTMIQVCKLVRANRHKTARNIARYGKNHQGWHYGFKLHAACDQNGLLSSLTLTPADVHDTRALPKLAEGEARVLVGDGGYTARVMREKLWNERGVFVLAPPHFKQRKKLAAWWQIMLLRARPKVESVFGILKDHLNLVSSFPRSITGYLIHYLRVLLSYQLDLCFA